MPGLNGARDDIYPRDDIHHRQGRSRGGRFKAVWLLIAVIALICAVAIYFRDPALATLDGLSRNAGAERARISSAIDGSHPAETSGSATTGADVSQDSSGNDAAGPTAPASQLFSVGNDAGTAGMSGLETPNASQDAASLLEDAEAAYGQQSWSEAIRLYTAVRDMDPSYLSVSATEHLALAYRNAALELLAINPPADDDLETARRYLREAVTLNPDDSVGVEENELLTGYLAGVRSLQFEEPNEAIKALLGVYEARPDYLHGLAAQRLYEAYVALGDTSYRRGETAVARDLYEHAVALNLENMDAADVRLASMNELISLTPTPYPANLPTVQAVAAARGLPPVLLPTPTPASMAEATARSEYATAVAVTTGTFTPEPAAYVTPILVYPSPPAENMATEVARAVEATARASAILVPTNTPMPYNAVMGEYVYATPMPENEATAQAQAVIAQGNLILYGTPTPLPWNAIVITPVPPEPTALPPTPTPLPTSTPVPLLVPVTELTATPTPVPTMTPPAEFPPELRNKIVFLSDRGGGAQVFLLDPQTGDVSLVTQDWVYPMADEQLPVAPDGVRKAVVLADSNRVLQIQVLDTQYSTTHQVTAVRAVQNTGAMAYDPAWSPNSDTIAYVSSEFAGDEIYIVNLGDGIPRRLTNNTWEWDKHPTWSPDGSQIVFYSNRDSGRMQLWIMNADGSGQRNLSSNEYNDWDPIWIR